MAKVRRHVLVCSNLDCLSWPLPRAVVPFELSGPQRLLLYEEIGPVKNKQRQTNLPNSAHRCNGLVIVTIFAPITIDSPPLLGVSRTDQQSPHATEGHRGRLSYDCGALASLTVLHILHGFFYQVKTDHK
jgi:hypothetical protein